MNIDFTVFSFFTQAAPHLGVWLLQVGVIIGLTLLLNYSLMYGLYRISVHVNKTALIWDDALLNAARLPLQLVVWCASLTLIFKMSEDLIGTDVLTYWPQIRKIGLILIVALFFSRFIGFAAQNSRDDKRTAKPLDENTAQAIARLLRLSVAVLAGLVILQTLGYSISGVIAFGGMGGIAIGFAAKDFLANIFGGLMLFLDKQFVVGDWVRSPDREVEGQVEEIGWRITRIRTGDLRPLYVPNSLFSNAVIENTTRMSGWRMSETIGVRYADSHVLPAVVEAIRDMLRANPAIDPDNRLLVNFDSYGASQLNIFVHAVFKTTNRAQFLADKEAILFAIMNIIQQHGADFPFPTQTLYLQTDRSEAKSS